MARETDVMRGNVQNDDKFDDREAHDELDNMENQDVPEDSLNHDMILWVKKMI